MGFMGHLPKLWDEMGQFLKIWDLWDGWEDCLGFQRRNIKIQGQNFKPGLVEGELWSAWPQRTVN